VKSAKVIENRFARALRKVARHSAGIIEMHVDGATLRDPSGVARAVSQYVESLTPWAQVQARVMVKAVAVSTAKKQQAQAKAMGKALATELSESAVGLRSLSLQHEAVNLITSLPTQAAERAQRLASEAVSGGRRPAEVAEELARTGEVTESRAMLIARTEVSRAGTALTQARSESIGSEGYIWRTSQDGDVRESHADMEGKYVRWDSPPDLDGMTGHAGELPNCRCYAEPVLPERDY
jgi:SPP1 gp7 family putative phage head morphogenesis protein